MHTLINQQFRAKLGRALASVISYTAVALFGMSIVCGTIGVTLIGSPACEGETMPGYLMVLVSGALCIATTYHLWYVDQLKQLEQAQAEAEAELAEDINAFRELTSAEQHLMGRIYQKRNAPRVQVTREYDNIDDEEDREPDYDNMGQDFQDMQHYSQTPVR